MQNTNPKNAFLLAWCVVLAVAVSCTPAAGLFSSIEDERPLDENATKTLMYSTPSFFATMGTNHYMVSGSLYRRPVGAHSAASWNRVNLSTTELGADPICASAAFDGTVLVLVLTKSDGSASGVYTYDGTVGTKIAITATGTPAAVYCAGATRFLVTRDSTGSSSTLSTTYAVWSGATFGTQALAFTEMEAPSNFVAFEAEFWFAAGSKVYKGSAAALADAALASETTPPPAGTVFTNIRTASFGGDSYILLTTKTGTLYGSFAGTTAWESKAIANDAGSALHLSDVALVNDTADRLIVSTQTVYSTNGTATAASEGYIEFVPGPASGSRISAAAVSPTPIIADANNKRTSLDARSVHLLAWDGVNKVLFAGLAAYGPWSNEYGSAWSGWTRE